MFVTTMPLWSMMSPQSPGAFAVRKRRLEAPLQHSATVVLVVEDVLVLVVGIGAEVELVVGAGVEVELVVGTGVDVELVVGVGDDVELVLGVGVVELVVSPDTDEELVELVLVVVDELPPIVVVEPATDVDVVELVVVEPPSDVEVVDGVACDVLVVDGRMVVVVGLPGFFSDGTQSSEALRHVPRNAVTSCSVNWSSTDTWRSRKSGCPAASTMR
jgi:hypothetical protein